MKQKSKGKPICQKYMCDTCEMDFYEEPYASINTPAGFKINVCSEPCWRVCLYEQQKLLKGFEDFIEDELMDFVEALAERADYEFVWESIKKLIEELRFNLMENHYKQLEQDAKQIS